MRAVTYLSFLATCGLATACSITTGVKTTFYGVPDNDPAGSDAIAFSCSSRGFHAGGTGTFSDPLTFASKQGSAYGQCEIVYFPYLKKYIRNEDICGACGKYQPTLYPYYQRWKGSKRKSSTADWFIQDTPVWIDIFTGNSKNGGNTQISCENALTPNAQQAVIRNPATNLEVDGTF
jgi:hypothetical protein